MAGFMTKSFVISVLVTIGIAAVLPTHESIAIGTKAALVRKEAPSHKAGKKVEKTKDKDSDFCNYNYVAGAAGDVDCDSGATGVAHTDGRPLHRIEDMAMCKEAAEEACRKAGKADSSECLSSDETVFAIPAAYMEIYPTRCFQVPVAGKEKMWYFNNGGATPSNLGGWPDHLTCGEVDADTRALLGECGANATQAAPVCSTKEFEDGHVDNTTGVAACPTAMNVISHEDTCRSAVTCLGLCPEDQFMVIHVVPNPMDVTGHHQHVNQTFFPLGCHINPDDGCGQFSTLAIPADKIAEVVGTPICNFTQATAATPAATTAAPA